MKLIFIMFLLASYTANASLNYYVDNGGSDANAGTSAGAAWQTLSKVNGFTFGTNDTLNFNANGIWNEKLIIPSGIAYIRSYNSGNKPIITGFVTVSGFSNIGGNLWQAVVSSSVSSQNTVMMNGALRAKGRYPNTGYLTLTTYNSRGSFTGTLTGTPNYAGAEAVVRDAHWILDVCGIISQSSGTFTLKDSLTYAPSVANLQMKAYFIQNSTQVLDTANEWYYSDTAKHLIIYSGSDPSGNVQASTIDTLVYGHNLSNVTFDGINFTGANKAAMHFDTCSHITVKNCTFNNNGRDAISAKKSVAFSVINDSITNTLNDALILGDYAIFSSPPAANSCDSQIITGNYIKNVGYLAGMGASGNSKYMGGYLTGTPITFKNNRSDSTGYMGFYFVGKSDIENNYITNWNFQKDDGGAINFFSPSSTSYNSGTIIKNNILIGGIGASSTGNVNPTAFSPGLYFDINSRGIEADSNSIANCFLTAIVVGGVDSITLKYNYVVDSLGVGIEITPSGAYHLSLKNNAYYSQANTIAARCILYTYHDYTQNIDSNVYSRPSGEDKKMGLGANLSFPEWQDTTGYDLHGHSTPVGITSALPFIYYNTTTGNLPILLTGLYYDIYGNPFNNSITLLPFQSTILFKSTSEVPSPVAGKKIGNLIFQQ